MRDPQVSQRVMRQSLPDWLTALTLAAITALGLALRVAGSRLQEPIVDELLSLLGAQTVAERGIPLLPSGVLYLHGTIHSYLVAPLVALGYGNPDDLSVPRLVSAVAGAIAILLTFRLARFSGAAAPASLFAAALVAIDPASVLWGSYLRMYAVAQPLAIAVALFFLKAISEEARFSQAGQVRQRTLWALVILFWLAVFTHLSTALLWPAMVAVAIVLYGPDLLRGQRDLAIALVACVLSPLLLIGLTGAIGPGAGTKIAGRSEGLPGMSFLGEDNVNLAQVLHPDPSPWTALFTAGPLELLMPLLLALASGLLIGRLLLADGGTATSIRPRMAGALLALYWLPILALALFATDAAERYAVYLLPTGYILLALAAETLIAPVRNRGFAGWAAAGGGVLALAVFLHGAVGATRLGPDGRAVAAAVVPAEEYIATHRQPGELILTSGAVETALTMGRLPELRFLPGGEGSQRSLRYTRFTADGRPIDYWIGMPSLYTTAELCRALQAAPGSWVMLSHRVWQNWGYNDLPPRLMERQSAALRELMLGLADQEYEDQDWIVFRTRPGDQWDQFAKATCNEGVLEPQRGERPRQRDTNDVQPDESDAAGMPIATVLKPALPASHAGAIAQPL